MGFPFQRTGFDKGIDGYMEIVDPSTGTATNNIILVQSKATTGDFIAETGEGFDYYCDERDLTYWISGNAPVILVISNPNRNEAYWVSIKDYFTELSDRKSHKVHFNKDKNRFDVNSKLDLIGMATPKDAGVYLSPLPKREALCSNLLEVDTFCEAIFVAPTEYHSRRTLWEEFGRMKVEPGNEFVLKNGQILTFHNLEEYPWSEICEAGAIESFRSVEWAYSDEPSKQNEFIELLYASLRQMLQPDVWYDKDEDYYYFSPTTGLMPRTLPRKGTKTGKGKTVFKAYMKKKMPTEVAYYRHSAFYGQFRLHDDKWYLEITPHYRFTWNGYRRSKFEAEQLTTIKRFELNPAVFGQVSMWADYLKAQGQATLLKSAYSFLGFGSLSSFELYTGIDDRSWLKRETSDKASVINSADNQLSLFDLLT